MARKEAPPAAETILEKALAGTGAVRRVIFGCPSYSRGGSLFAGVSGDGVFLRLSDADRAKVMSGGGRPFEPLKGRTLKMYAVLPASAVADGKALSSWLRRAMDFVDGLPKRPRKRTRVARKPGK